MLNSVCPRTYDIQTFLYFSAKMADGSGVLLELELSASPRLCVNCVGAHTPLVAQAVKEILL